MSTKKSDFIDRNNFSRFVYMNSSKARRLQDNGKYSESIRLFSKSIRVDPYNNVHWFNRAYSRYYLEFIRNSRNDFLISRTLGGVDLDIIVCLGHLSVAEYDMEKGLEYYNKAIEMDENDPDCYSSRAMIYNHMYKFDLSLKDSLKSIELEKANDAAFYEKGQTFRFKNKHKEALECFQQGLVVCDTIAYKSALNAKIAQCYIGMRKINKSIEYIVKAESLGCESRELNWETKALFYKTIKDYKSSLECIEEAINYMSNLPRLVVERCSLNRYLGKLDGIEKICFESMKKDKFGAYHHVELSQYYLVIGEYEKALKQINLALNKNPENYKFYRIKGNIFLKMKKYEEAEELLTKSFLMYPTSAKTLKIRAQLYREIEDIMNAEKDEKMIIEIMSKREVFDESLMKGVNFLKKKPDIF